MEARRKVKNVQPKCLPEEDILAAIKLMDEADVPTKGRMLRLENGTIIELLDDGERFVGAENPGGRIDADGNIIWED